MKEAKIFWMNRIVIALVAAAVVAQCGVAFAQAPAPSKSDSGGAKSAPAAKTVRVHPSRDLGSVNGVAIKLKDLMALPPQKTGAEQTMSTERYEFLFNRAVEREMILQEARREGVELTDEQKRQLENLRQRGQQGDTTVFDTVQASSENTDFLLRDLTGQMLQTRLAEKAGVPSRHVNAGQVEKHFQQHRSEFKALPAEAGKRRAAWASIDSEIRQKLTPQVEAEHHEKSRLYIEKLKGRTKTTANPPAAD